MASESPTQLGSVLRAHNAQHEHGLTQTRGFTQKHAHMTQNYDSVGLEALDECSRGTLHVRDTGAEVALVGMVVGELV